MIRRNKERKYASKCAEMVFRPALTPLEASVLPAQERRAYGALKMAESRFDWTARGARQTGQRTKI